MPDVLPALSQSYRSLTAAFWATVEPAGYQEMSAPLLEHTALYERSLGTGSEVVSKEMYTFPSPLGGSSRSGSGGSEAAGAGGAGTTSLTLRPEGTAGILRAILAAGLHRKATPARVGYSGAMFRHERPQRGRQRQFTQVGIELVGSSGAGAGPSGCAGVMEDVEVIALAHRYLRAVLPLHAPLPELRINSLGSDTRAHAAALAAHFGACAAALSPDSQARLARGSPLRILDSKDPADAPHIAAAPPAQLPEQDQQRYQAVLAGLRGLGLAPVHSPTLVRGLDYYAHTIFEFVAEGGATVLAGGRYDRLPAQMLGSSAAASSSGAVTAVGWAAGVERLHLLRSEGCAPPAPAPPLRVAILPVGLDTDAAAWGAAMALWAGCTALAQQQAAAATSSSGAYGVHYLALPPRPSLHKLLAKADAMGAGAALILGTQELAAGQVLVKSMAGGGQVAVGFKQGGRGIFRGRAVRYFYGLRVLRQCSSSRHPRCQSRPGPG
jgi:histidyl-tRNA synthetase